MPVITVLPAGKSATVEPGTNLLVAIAAAGGELKHKCTDSTCSGLCHIFVPTGKKSLSKAQRTENEMLDTIVGVGSKSRLACQAQVGDEDVTVELLSALSG